MRDVDLLAEIITKWLGEPESDLKGRGPSIKLGQMISDAGFTRHIPNVVWPEKKEIPETVYTSGWDNCGDIQYANSDQDVAYGWNKCHDAFMKVIEGNNTMTKSLSKHLFDFAWNWVKCGTSDQGLVKKLADQKADIMLNQKEGSV